MKRTLLFAATTLLALGTMNAQRKVTINLSDDGKAKMEGFLPKEPSGRAIVDLPGGGYTHLAMNHEGYDWAPFYNEQGIAYFVVTYRMPGGDRNIPLSDAQNAIKVVRDSAAAWGINPSDVGIMGSSAGGHLATSVATHAPFESEPNFQILFYPVVSMDSAVTHFGSVNGFLGEGRKDKKIVEEWSNMNRVNVRTSPAVIFLSSNDAAVPPITNGVAYYTALVNAGVPADLHAYKDGGHGWGFNKGKFAYHDNLHADLKLWLRRLPAAKNDPRLNRKKIAFIGDSYVYNHHDPREYTWMYKFAKRYGMKYQCLGQNGTCIAMDRPGKPNEAIYKRYTQIEEGTDYIVIVAGHNDSSRGRIDSIGKKEFTKQLTNMIKGMRERYPQAQILMFSPWRSVQEGATDNASALKAFHKTPREKVVDLEAKVCKKLGVPFFDAARDTTVQVWDPEFRKKYFQGPKDNAHLNNQGHNLFLPVAEKWILENIK